MHSLDDLSQSVAGAVNQIVSGVPPSRVRAPPIPVRAEFDARELARWHIDRRALPPGAELRFVPVSMLRRQRPALIAVGVSALAILTLLVAVALERRRRHRADLAQSAMSVMAGALAHELGQPITAQHLNATAALALLRNGQLDAKHAHALLTDIATAAGRASDIASAIRQLLQTKELRREPVALDALVMRTSPRVTAAVGHDAARVELDLSSAFVLGDAVLLQQVVFNLLLNAHEAVERNGAEQGHITVRTGRDGQTAARLEVIDNGPGIVEDAEHRVFEPFVTSKPKGLGLGLSLCRLIVEAHGGTLVSEPSPTRGARLVARFPIAPAAGAERTQSVSGATTDIHDASSAKAQLRG
jgi:signal transduction histidine kinase